MAAQEHFLKKFKPDMLEPGDVLATNDPEIGTGHLPDVTMITPIFHRGRIVAYAGSIAHLPDVGGRPLSPDASDIFEEGIRFPVLKLLKAGVPNQDVLDVIAASVRLPNEVMGDINSMVAANEVMGRELVKFLDEYGIDDVSLLSQAIHRRSEAHMRAAIRAWPNGTYRAETALDGFDSEVTLRVAVVVDDETIHVDYEGTSAQVPHGINVRRNYRFAHSVYALKCLLDPATPNNEGCLIPITDAAPVGSILNPHPSAPGNSRNLVGHILPSLIFKALQEVVPQQVQADSGGAPIWAINCQGRDENGRQYGAIQNFHGGQGGRATADGNDTLSFPSNCRVTAIELFEQAVPVLTVCKELIPGSGGAGEFRGGLGQRGTVVNRSSTPMNVYLASERVLHPCFGVLGGEDGRRGRVLKNGGPVAAKGKLVLQPGDSLTLETPGGGGWGDASRRSPALVKQDLVDGLVLAEPDAGEGLGA